MGIQSEDFPQKKEVVGSEQLGEQITAANKKELTIEDSLEVVKKVEGCVQPVSANDGAYSREIVVGAEQNHHSVVERSETSLSYKGELVVKVNMTSLVSGSSQMKSEKQSLEITGFEDCRRNKQLLKVVQEEEEVYAENAMEKHSEEEVLAVPNEIKCSEFNDLIECVDTVRKVQLLADGTIRSEGAEDCVKSSSIVPSNFVDLYKELELLQRRLERQRVSIQDVELKMEENKKAVMSSIKDEETVKYGRQSEKIVLEDNMTAAGEVDDVVESNNQIVVEQQEDVKEGYVSKDTEDEMEEENDPQFEDECRIGAERRSHAI